LQNIDLHTTEIIYIPHVSGNSIKKLKNEKLAWKKNNYTLNCTKK